MADVPIQQMLETAAAHFRAGRLAEAQDIYRQILRRDPDQVQAIEGMGLLARQVGRAPLAAAYFGRAVQLRPDVPILQQRQGEAWLAAGDFDQAAACLRNAIRLDPGRAEPHFYLGAALEKLHQPDDAIASLCEAVRLNPALLDAQIELARQLELAGRRDEAAGVHGQIGRLTPGNPNVAFHVAALTGQPAPPAMPAAMVAALFDPHAETFDQHLTHLHYRVPRLLLDAVTAAGAGKDLAVLDLGCGTGLVGELFRPMAARLVGVDLSTGMLAKARQRGVYDDLQQADVLAAMRSNPGAYDLVLAGDVLCYLGDLSEVFQAAFASLYPGGLFAFSVELHDASGWILRPSRRYAHAVDYVHETARAAGFEILRSNTEVLRMDADQDVNGLLAVLKRP